MQYDNETKELIEQLDKQAKEIQAKVDELKNSGCKCVRWRAKDNSTYYHVCADGKVTIFNESPTHKGFNNYLHSIGNYFKTKEEAEKYKQHLIITQKLKDIALRLNNGIKINFKSRRNYRICLDYYPKLVNNMPRLHQYYNDAYRDTNTIYCLSDKFLETAIKEIGEKELIEYIKNS